MVIKIDRAGYAEECLDRTVSESLVTIDMGRHMAMYYAPVTPTEQSGVAVVMMHCDQNYMAFPMAAGLARRGYQVLAADSWVGAKLTESSSTSESWCGICEAAAISTRSC